MSEGNCRITTRTRTEGTEFTATFSGILERIANGYAVTYSEDKDEVTLLIGQRAFWMNRTGETGISLRFLQGKETRGILTVANSSGEIAVRTNDYEVKTAENSLLIVLNYELVYPTHSQRFELKITIDYSEEK